MMALPFLPVVAFIVLCNEPLVANNATIQQFVIYCNGQFPVRMWNVFHSNVRTNKRLESWHSRLNRTVGLTHPNTETRTNLDRTDTATGLTRQLSRAHPPANMLRSSRLSTFMVHVLQSYSARQLN